MRIVGVLLAAGRGTRFGSDKLLATLPGTDRPMPVAVAAASNLVAALAESCAVVRDADGPVATLLRPTGVRIVRCARADLGMGESLACAVAAASDADAWVVALADMPWIAPDTIARVASALESGADLVAPRYRGERGHPVGFARRHYAALAALTGDAGARALLLSHRDRMTLIDVADPGILADVDTPGDLTRGANGGRPGAV